MRESERNVVQNHLVVKCERDIFEPDSLAATFLHGDRRCLKRQGGSRHELSVSQQSNEKLGDKEIDNQNQYRRDDDSLRGGASYALRATARRHTEVAADGGDNKSEKNGFDEPSGHVAPDQRLPGRGPVLPRVQAQKQARDHVSAHQSQQGRDDGQKKQTE